MLPAALPDAILQASPISIAEVRQATRRREWAVQYQPIADLYTGCWIGAEVLLRWRNPSRGWLLPGAFIDLVENSDEIFGVTTQVIGLASRALGRLVRHRRVAYLSLNLVAAHLRRPAILQELLWAVQRAGAEPSSLMLELTERGVVDDTDGVASGLVARLTQHGFQVAIDDFGTREASFEYLQRLPVSQLKVDKCLVDAVDTLPRARKVLQGLMEFARCVDVSVVAEGVERESQLVALRQLGIRYAQGFAIGRPMSFEMLKARLESQPEP